MNERPLVSVVMAVFNGEKYLREALSSILMQTMDEFELIIVDDGSTDRSLEIAGSFHDARIRIIENGRNLGLAASLNKGIDAAHGAYIARMDCDDVSYPKRFARQLEALQDDPALDLVATRAITINEDDQATGLFPCAMAHEEICARPWRGFHFPHPTWMGRTEWFRKHRYTIPGPYCSEDQELLLRSYRDSRFGTVNEILFAYRIRSKVDWRKRAKTRRTILAAQWRYFSGLAQWRLALLAAAAFALKTIGDFSKRLADGALQPGGGIVDESAASAWRQVQAGLTAKYNVP